MIVQLILVHVVLVSVIVILCLRSTLQLSAVLNNRTDLDCKKDPQAMLQVPGRSGVWEPLPDCFVARVRKFHPPRNDPKPRTGAENSMNRSHSRLS